MISHIVKIVKSKPGARSLSVRAGVGFSHRDGDGISLKFDTYPADNEEFTIVVRERQYAGQDGVPWVDDQPLDLCQVRSHETAKYNTPYNKWVRIGSALPHSDGRGYTLQFDIRPSAASVEAGGNLVVRKSQSQTHCTECGKHK